jgi:HPt (histidine-containing phosphotransfer) domain-containing protein
MTASALKGEKLKCIGMGMNDYLTKPFEFSFFYEHIRGLLAQKKADEIIEASVEQENTEFFDLSMLEELEDNEYLSQMIEIFLNTTLLELNEMEKQLNADEFENVYKAAHKLKSSTGLMKANKLFDLLVNIEEAATSKSKKGLLHLIPDALGAFHQLENPLKENLERIKTSIKVA